MTIIWSGLSTGAMFALVAIGYNVVLTSCAILNFSQGAVTMFGTFIAYLAVVTLRMPTLVAVLFCIVIGTGLGFLIELVAVRPLRRNREHGSHAELITTVGVSTALVGCASLIWGTTPLAVNLPGSYHSVTLLGGDVLPLSLILIGVCVVIAAGLHLWSHFTLHGLARLATAEDRDAAKLRAIDVSRQSRNAFLLAGAIAGLAGILIAPVTYGVTTIADTLAISGFVALAFGGFGSQPGAVMGGFVCGLAQAFAGRYLGSSYQDLAVFAILMTVLLIRPSGLLGREALRRA